MIDASKDGAREKREGIQFRRMNLDSWSRIMVEWARVVLQYEEGYLSPLGCILLLRFNHTRLDIVGQMQTSLLCLWIVTCIASAVAWDRYESFQDRFDSKRNDLLDKEEDLVAQLRSLFKYHQSKLEIFRNLSLLSVIHRERMRVIVVRRTKLKVQPFLPVFFHTSLHRSMDFFCPH